MKNILTLAMNPGIDKSSSVEHVITDRKLNCKPPRFEPGGGGVSVSRAIKKTERGVGAYLSRRRLYGKPA